jgi:cell division protein YceG involved in septum cleavage
MKKSYRTYNHKLSAEMNKKLDRRARTVFFERQMIAATAILVISLTILFCTGIRVFASAGEDNRTVHKYYTNIQVHQGDTMWDIADRYIDGYDIDKQDYIDEMCQLNHLEDGNIHSGDYLVVAYYSYDVQ